MASLINYQQNPLFINILALSVFRSYFAAHDTDCIFTATGAVCKLFAKSVSLICDTFGVFWFLSLEHVIFYCFSFSFRIPSQLKMVQLHL